MAVVHIVRFWANTEHSNEVSIVHRRGRYLPQRNGRRQMQCPRLAVVLQIRGRDRRCDRNIVEVVCFMALEHVVPPSAV